MKPLYSKRSHFITLFFLVLISWSVTVLLGPLVGVIAADFGLASEIEIGNISAIFLLVGGVFSFVWVGLENHLFKRYKASRKNLLILATFIWVIGLFLTSASQNYGELFAFQMLTAVGYAAITPLAFSMAMDLTPPEDRAKAFGFLDMAAMIGVGIGFLLSGILIDFVPWGVPFVVIATFGMILAGFTFDISDPKRGVQDHELSEVLSKGVEYTFRISRKSLSSMLKNKTNVLILLFNVVLYIASGSISYYFIRMMVNDHGFSSSLAVLFFLATYGSQAVGVVFWTRRADKKFAQHKNGKVKVLMESLLTGPFFLIAAYSLVFTITDGSLIGIFALLLTVGAFLLSGLIAISFSILGEINPPEMRTTIFSLNNLAQTLGRGMGIFIIGGMFTVFGGMYQWGFMVMGGIYLLSIIFTFPLMQSVPKELTQLNRLLQRRARDLERRIT